MAREILTAVDIGSYKITTVIVSLTDGESRPSVIGVNTVASKGIKKGVIVNINEATEAINESLSGAEKMAGVSVQQVLVNINGENITSLNNRGVVAVGGSEITEEDVARVIENAKTISLPQNINPIHVAPREYTVDNQKGIKYPVGMTGMRLEVDAHIITANMSAFQNLRKCVTAYGHTVADITYPGLASAAAVLTETERELGVCMLDIGAGTTSIAVYQDGSVIFTGTVPLGGNNITSDILLGLKVTLEEAEKIKINYDRIVQNKMLGKQTNDKVPALLKKNTKDGSISNPDDMVDLSSIGVTSKTEISKSLLQEIVQARVEDIMDIVIDRVSKAGYEVAQPAGVVVTGGSAGISSITKMIQSKTGVSCRVGYPTGLVGMIEEIGAPAFSTVQGMIIYSMNSDTNQIAISSGSSTGGLFGGIGEKLKSWFEGFRP